ncbi:MULTISPECIES: hypothetical protein [Actinomycetes]|nr:MULTISPECIES: hypothetical protein [Actinomycetes]
MAVSAGAIVCLALARHHLEYLILLAYVPPGYAALLVGSRASGPHAADS